MYSALEHIASFSVLVPLLIGIVKFKALNRTLWALIFYLALSFTFDRLYLRSLPDINEANTLLNCWTILEGTIILAIFFFETKSKTLKKLVVGITIAFAIFIFCAFYKDITIEDKVVAPMEAGIIILLSTSYFVTQLYDNTSEKIMKYYFFWINSGLLIYSSASILIFATNDYLIYLSEHAPSKGILIWTVHNVVAIFCNLLVAFGIWQVK